MAKRARDPSPGLFPEHAPEPGARARRAGRERGARARRADRELGPSQGFAEVVLDHPLRQVFTYAIPEQLAPAVRPGMRVAVPLGARREVGIVVALTERPGIELGRVRALLGALDSEPLIDAELLALTRWVAEEYASSWGVALHAVLPAALKRERGSRRVLWAEVQPGIGADELASLAEAQPEQHRLLRTLLECQGPTELRDLLRRLNLSDSPAKTLAKRGWVRLVRGPQTPDPFELTRSDRARPESLSADQARAVAAIAEALERRTGATFLLEGVTGSGKTEVYLRVIERALAAGRGAIVLVPEIALTPQTVGWFRARFEKVAVLHSRMTDAQRLDMWTRTRKGEARVVVGARSAVFAPVPELGVLVVDEEHEPSFKQGSAPRYHARDVAMRRARELGAVCVLGSATPALESWEAARRGEIEHLVLRERIGSRPMPEVEVVDMRQEQYEIGREGLFSRRLAWLVQGALERGEQAILFLNRRGFAPVLWCPGCKQTVRCPTCDVGLTFHRRIGRAVCHACCAEIAPPRVCPGCTFPGLRYLGAGSERVDAALRSAFPEARVARMDSDTMRRRQDYEERLDAFGRGEIDLLVGTQMIAKGLDFPRVTVVGIVQADAALHLPDFRAAERTFQLVAQVAGRAGRGELAGRILLQTTSPEHPAIQRAARHDFAGFAAGETLLREELGYPPHGRLVRVLADDPDAARVEVAMAECAATLRAALEPHDIAVLGPAPAPIAQLRGRFRQHLLVKSSREPRVFERARSAVIEATAGFGARPRVAIDVDPVDLL